MTNKTIRAIIIDDEEESRNILERLLQRLEIVEIMGKAKNGDEGIDLLLQHRPDLVFLDIQMPGKDGFDVIDRMKQCNIDTYVIFVTAYVEYAINALKKAAFDYLLKPVDFAELQETVQRFVHEKQNKLSGQNINTLLDLINKKDKIFFNTRSGYIYVNPSDIIFCNADVNYTEIQITDGRKEVVTINISKVEKMLNNRGFFRISRSYLINTEYLIKADRKSRTCELIKDQQRYTIPAPVKQIRLLENLIRSGNII